MEEFAFDFDEQDRQAALGNFEETIEGEMPDLRIKEIVRGAERRSLPILNQFEEARLIMDRVKMLDEGAETELTEQEIAAIPRRFIRGIPVPLRTIDIAKEELRRKILPIILLRPMPNQTLEEWSISELRRFEQ